MQKGDGDSPLSGFGENLARARRAAGLTQQGLAEKISYSDKLISKWERGEGLPDLPTALTLARTLGVPLDTLLGIAGESEPSPDSAGDDPASDSAPPAGEQPLGRGASDIASQNSAPAPDENSPEESDLSGAKCSESAAECSQPRQAGEQLPRDNTPLRAQGSARSGMSTPAGEQTSQVIDPPQKISAAQVPAASQYRADAARASPRSSAAVFAESEHSSASGSADSRTISAGKSVGKTERRRRIFIHVCASLLPFLVAAAVFVLLRLAVPGVTPRPGFLLLLALAAAGIVSTVLAVKWWGAAVKILSVSTIVWSVAAALFLALRRVGDARAIFIAAAVLQVLTVLWFLMPRRKKKRDSAPCEDTEQAGGKE